MNMIITQKPGYFPIIIALVLMVIGFGCIQPDRWPVFEQPETKLTTLPILTQLNQAFLEEIPLSGHGKIESPPEKTVPFAVPTGNILNLSLDQALVMALESNPGIRVAKYNPVLAGFSEQIEQGRFDPELFSEFSYARDRTQEMDADTFTWDRAGEQNHNVLMGLSQKFPSGTDIEIDVTHGIDDIYLGPEEQKVRMGMTVTQALLRGYGSSVNLASIRQAKLNTAVTVHELRGIIEALLADTETAYWDHVLDRQKIDIFENSLDVAKKQLSEVEQSIEIGTLPFIESAVARVEVALREQALIDAKSAFEESRLRLLFYVNQGRDGLYELQVLPTTNALSDPEPEGSTKDHLKLADQYRSDLQEARLRMKQNRLEIVKTRNGILPRLDLFISLGKTGYADSFSNSFRAMNESTYDLSAGIQFSRTLGNRSAKAKDSAARVTLEQAREALENLGQIIQRDVRIVLNDLDRARQQINATRVTRMLQEESVKAEQERFKAGTSTGLLVAQAQRDLLASHILEVAAIIDYRKALVKLYLAEGSLLERRGVSLF